MVKTIFWMQKPVKVTYIIKVYGQNHNFTGQHGLVITENEIGLFLFVLI
jgi:hypothetical protein